MNFSVTSATKFSHENLPYKDTLIAYVNGNENNLYVNHTCAFLVL